MPATRSVRKHEWHQMLAGAVGRVGLGCVWRLLLPLRQLHLAAAAASTQDDTTHTHTHTHTHTQSHTHTHIYVIISSPLASVLFHTGFLIRQVGGTARVSHVHGCEMQSSTHPSNSVHQGCAGLSLAPISGTLCTTSPEPISRTPCCRSGARAWPCKFTAAQGYSSNKVGERSRSRDQFWQLNQGKSTQVAEHEA